MKGNGNDWGKTVPVPLHFHSPWERFYPHRSRSPSFTPETGTVLPESFPSTSIFTHNGKGFTRIVPVYLHFHPQRERFYPNRSRSPSFTPAMGTILPQSFPFPFICTRYGNEFTPIVSVPLHLHSPWERFYPNRSRPPSFTTATGTVLHQSFPFTFIYNRNGNGFNG